MVRTSSSTSGSALTRPTRADLDAARGRELPDLLGADVRLLVVGINPSLWSAATQAHFAHPSNRFYPALLAAGIVDRRIDVSAGMSEPDRQHLLDHGVGITNLVARATARASEVTPDELRAGIARVETLVGTVRPAVVAVAGVTAYRTAFGRPRASLGLQPEQLGAAALQVVPNPSGLNAHETVASLADAYAAAAHAAGITLGRSDRTRRTP
jgi:TDG/mug DNA glycosylase family protein